MQTQKITFFCQVKAVETLEDLQPYLLFLTVQRNHLKHKDFNLSNFNITKVSPLLSSTDLHHWPIWPDFNELKMIFLYWVLFVQWSLQHWILTTNISLQGTGDCTPLLYSHCTLYTHRWQLLMEDYEYLSRFYLTLIFCCWYLKQHNLEFWYI